MKINYVAILKELLKYKFENKVSLIVGIIVETLTFSIALINIAILLYKFNNINGWSSEYIVLLYSLNLFAFSISGIFFKRSMSFLETYILYGKLDSFLIRPVNIIVQLFIETFSINYLGNIILSGILLIYSVKKINILNIRVICILIFGIIIGVMLHSCMLIISGSINFWLTKSGLVTETLITSVNNFNYYPLSIFGKGIQMLFTFILPFGFINYYPIEYLRDAKYGFGFLIFGVIVSIIYCILTWIIWNRGIKRYGSAGC